MTVRFCIKGNAAINTIIKKYFELTYPRRHQCYVKYLNSNTCVQFICFAMEKFV